MKHLIFLLLVVAIFSSFAGCAKRQAIISPPLTEEVPSGEEKIIWSSHEKRPEWLYREPDIEGDLLYFVGLSGKFAMEKDARDDAHRTAIANVVRYIGTLAQDKFQRVVTTYGLSSQVADPTKAARGFEEQLSAAFAARVKPQEWYIEQRLLKKTKETYYVAYVLAKVPKSAIDQAYQEAMNNTVDDLKKKRDAAADEQAKGQFQKAMEAFEDAKSQGFSLEK